MQKKVKGENLIQFLIFPKLPGAYEVLTGSSACSAYHRTLFTPKEA